ncbi:DUF7003 family protein [Chitinophaga ginsengisoli]|uniref:Uncharacterized protein n=1 Tax=Chitinophaga ginsengisoli TaxID=363837 RepID=A0A2P8G2R8_9BACT|nr:hypothetical protein [Chitinophaga ginsengisoli]PSL28165.1 hypothetical protein CLV42_10884 [Chitinophaga ginsengisoli]
MPNDKAVFSKNDILTQLDACAKDFNFPVLDNGYIYPVTSRLSVFGDLERWVIVVEVVGYHYRFSGHGGVENCLYIYGNSLGFEPGINNDNVLLVTADSDEGAVFVGDQWGTLNPDVHSMLIRDQKISIPKDPAFYAARNVELKNPPSIRVYEFMRASLPEYKTEFLAVEDEIYDCFRQNLPKIMQLDEWYHPDIAGEERPSENETFQMIAAVLESGDSSLYKPTKSANNHWSNWPYGGSL